MRRLPLQSQGQVPGAGLDLVLGLQVVHAVRGDAIDGRDQVSDAEVGPGRLSTIRQLGIHNTPTHTDTHTELKP